MLHRYYAMRKPLRPLVPPRMGDSPTRLGHARRLKLLKQGGEPLSQHRLRFSYPASYGTQWYFGVIPEEG